MQRLRDVCPGTRTVCRGVALLGLLNASRTFASGQTGDGISTWPCGWTPLQDLSRPAVFASEEERGAAIAFFNAAYRAEESGLRQAHDLADETSRSDPQLAECLPL
jgi:hypothetical protein